MSGVNPFGDPAISHGPECNQPCDAYTSHPTRLRILRQGDEERPWMLDGWDPSNGHYTEPVWTFPTFAETIAAIPDFIKEVQEA